MSISNKKNVLPALLFYLCLGFVWGACTGNDSGSGKNKNDGQLAHKNETPKVGEKECYNYIVNGDTIILTLKWLDTSKFTGSMVYRLKEKDGNIGTLEGQRRDSILLADYRFSSEGITSTREVAFKKIADYMVEGFGDVSADSSGFKFTSPDSLTFDLNKKLHQVNCL
ncbi:hypothetical protein [Arachidicoccus terrestris]|uniref:hypothetical protein n=1 Tax=Arachidicoccus terrestris TaxID=2875539 RepID=UPI001CC54E4F|nr:hypothetical protein [Arachidicoccus terrestris]UAY55645.1 hypothetical protein K9M52_01025 [Arachidicoccus terrestris]